MIIFFVGTPGSGKTYEAVKKIIDNLRLGRTVCTNIDGMDDPQQQEYTKSLLDMDDFTYRNNFVFLNQEQTSKFWKTEKKESVLPLSGEVVQSDVLICPKGSLIVIDEAHKYFNARDWQNKDNREMADWASTHRHDGYDLVLITQDIEKVEKQVRSLTEWCYFFRKVNFLGGSVSKKYLCYAYSGDDHRGTPLSKNVRTYQAKYFPCYKSYTSADAKEVGFMTHVNILKHPVFFIIPLLLVFTFWMASKSSLASGDLFGTDKLMKESAKRVEDQRKQAAFIPSVPVQSPMSSNVLAETPEPAATPPLPDSSTPAWHTYNVSAYILDGSNSHYMIRGVILKANQCRNFNVSLKTVECFGPLILPDSPRLSPALTSSSHKTASPAETDPELDRPVKFYSNESVPGTDHKQRHELL